MKVHYPLNIKKNNLITFKKYIYYFYLFEKNFKMLYFFTEKIYFKKNF